MTRKEYYLWFVKCMGVGNPRSHQILEKYDDIAEFYEDCKNKQLKKGIRLTESELKFLYQTSLSDIEYVFEKYSRFKAKIITIEDELYPCQLRNIDNPPLVLFVVGDITHLEDELLLTVVGTRKESLYGRRACELICSELCVSGFSIVSGLANGGDTTAHITALKCGARTYGFLACGLDVDYPYGKSALKNAIVKNGAIITEFLPGTSAFPENFHIRNRLLSGISEGTLVIESPKRSGTLITANNAVNQGKDVFAVPAGIFWINSAGTNELIKNGAKPVRDALDIIEDYLDRFPNKINVPNQRVNLREIYETNRRLGLFDANSPSAVDSEYREAIKQAKKDLKKAGNDAIKGKAIDSSDEQILPDISERLKQSGLNENQDALKIIDELKSSPLTMDELSDLTKISSSKLMVITTKLELAQIVKKVPGNRIELIG
ncbi:MAG: DNA-protecting protein DprA [Ruminococcaceae bacterium]|nr:DNA-protecting protein DprA [Oscillospiraceae bacterium]